ncbi:MAG TPA: ATP-binding protein [Terriglobales bacterium]|nr:ATP-binding protein [Terriglobales bacterium]
MKRPLLSVNLRVEQDVVLARQRARDVCEFLGFDHSEQIRLATATSEIARNAFRYAHGGRVEFLVDSDTPPKLVIKVRDAGPGIPNLDEILEGRYQSSTGLGKGIIGTQRLMDSFSITTGAEGTTVEMSKLTPRYAPALSLNRLEDMTRRLSQKRLDNPYAEIEKQNDELLKTLAELRARQEELVSLNRELEDTNRGVVALYAELDDRADALRRMSDAKTSFLSNMSHEFRTPLNSILSLSQMLMQRLDGELTSEQEKQVAFIRLSAQGLQEMVNDLLDIAKVEAGKVEVKAKEFEIEDLFGALRGMLKPILQTSSVNLVFEDPENLPTMFTDEGKISQILRNFVSNALKYTPRGEVRVSAKLKDAETVVFAVADTGIGIALEDQQRVFEEFVQVQNPLQKRTKGTGLGLPLSRNLARLLGGSVSLTSEAGVGSTFCACIPVVYPGARQQASELPPLQPDRIPVVVIEDNRETAFLMSKFLENTEFQAIPAHDTATGLDFVARSHPAAVVLDVVMNGESSWEAFRQISDRKIPVISASIMAGERDRATAMGATAFLHKPVTRDMLLKTLRSVAHRGAVRKLLLIDDDELSRYSVHELLSATNVEILEARSGREGLRMASEEHPDVIFLDLMMPDISGFEVLQELRASEFGRTLPVVVHSSKDLSSEEKDKLSFPMVTLLSKRDTSGPEAIERVGRALLSVGFSFEPVQQHA